MHLRLVIMLLMLAPLTALADDPKPTGPPPAPKPPEAIKHVAELGWMVGTWKGTGTYSGRPFTDTTTYKWMYGKTFIHAVYEARMGKEVVWRDSTTVGWDKVKKRLTWFTFGMDGTIGQAYHDRSKARDKKDVWVVYGSLQSDDPNFKESRNTITRTGPHTYQSLIQSKNEKGEWVTFMTMKAERVRPRNAPPGAKPGGSTQKGGK